MAPKAYSSFFFQIPQLPPSAPPLPTRPPSSHYKSFLSLDRPDSILHTDAESIYSTSSSFFPTVKEKSTRRRDPPSPSRSTSPASQASTQRSLPRPKPAPRVTPPDVPYSSSSSYARPSQSRAQTTPAVPRSRTRDQPAPAPTYPSSSDSYYSSKTPRPTSTITASSTASTHYRHTKRTDALARLEGRVPATSTRPPSPPPYSPRVTSSRTKSAAPVLATKSFMPFSEDDSGSDDDDDDALDGWPADVRVQLVPMPASPGLDIYTRSREKKGRSRAGTIESWFVGPPPPSAPVPKNFMDL